MAGMCLRYSIKCFNLTMFLQSPLTKLIVADFAVFFIQDAHVQKHTEVEMMCECFNNRFVRPFITLFILEGDVLSLFV